MTLVDDDLAAPEVHPLADQVAIDLLRIARGAAGHGEGALRQLAATLRADPGALAGIALPAGFPPDDLLPDSDHGRIDTVLGVLSTLRDVLVLAPIGLTWWSLRSAFEAYPAGSTESFLTFWRDGGSHPALGSTAIGIVALVMLVMLLTITCHAGERWAELRSSAEDERAELSRLLSLATAVVAASRRGSEAGALANAAEGLRRVSVPMRAAADALRVSVERLAAGSDSRTSERLSAVIAEITATSQETRAALEAVRGALADRTAVLGELSAVRRDIQQDQQDLRDAVAALASTVTTRTAALVAATEKATGDLGAAGGKAVDDLRAALGNALATLAMEQTAQYQILDSLTRLTRALGDALTGLTEQTEAMLPTVGSIARIAERISETT